VQTACSQDKELIELIEANGKRWKEIAAALKPGDRTAAMVRNRWIRIQRGRALTAEGKSKNRCGVCGELKRGHICKRRDQTVIMLESASREISQQEGAELACSSVEKAQRSDEESSHFGTPRLHSASTIVMDVSTDNAFNLVSSYAPHRDRMTAPETPLLLVGCSANSGHGGTKFAPLKRQTSLEMLAVAAAMDASVTA